MLKFLIDGKPKVLPSGNDSTAMNQISQIWNLGHIVQCLRYMLKHNWTSGIKCLFSLRRVKQVFASVNDVNSFIDLLYVFLDYLTSEDASAI
jgi:hypothetical protein